MTLKLEIKMDNVAFDPNNPHDEAARILRVAADKIEAGAWSQILTDFNGNRVGEVKVTR
jgi:hypothetical protein